MLDFVNRKRAKIPLFLTGQGQCYVRKDPEQCGFGDIFEPDGFRPVYRYARCFLRSDPLVGMREGVLEVIATSNKSKPFLAVSLNGEAVGGQYVTGYGHYFFRLEEHVIAACKESDPEVELRIAHNLEGSALSNKGDCVVYDIRTIHLEQEETEERSYLQTQLKIFEPESSFSHKVLQELDLPAEATILDLGAGEGWTTALLAARLEAAEAWGVDVRDFHELGQPNWNTQIYERLRRNRGEIIRRPDFESFADVDYIGNVARRCRFVTMKAEKLLVRNNYFDFVHSLNTFEHIQQPDRALAEIARVLKPKGCALLMFQPLYYSDDGSHLAACGLLSEPWVHLRFTREEIKAQILAVGGVPNEVDNILDSLNGWSISQFKEILESTKLELLELEILEGFALEESENCVAFEALREEYSLEDLTTVGVRALFKKQA